MQPRPGVSLAIFPTRGLANSCSDLFGGSRRAGKTALDSEYIATWGERLTPCCSTPFACPTLIFLWPVSWLCVDDRWTETSFFIEYDRYEQTRRIYILYLYIYIYIYTINIYSIVYTRPLLQLTRGTIRLDLKGRAESMTYIFQGPSVVWISISIHVSTIAT